MHIYCLVVLQSYTELLQVLSDALALTVQLKEASHHSLQNQFGK